MATVEILYNKLTNCIRATNQSRELGKLMGTRDPAEWAVVVWDVEFPDPGDAILEDYIVDVDTQTVSMTTRPQRINSTIASLLTVPYADWSETEHTELLTLLSKVIK